MGVFVAMLRGVNIGGHHKVPMQALRELFEELGYAGAVTFIQSGNVVFRTRERDEAAIATRIGDGIERKFGFRAEVILRTVGELRETVARNPFAKRTEVAPNRLAVMFLTRDPGPEARERVLAIRAGAEELRFEGRELFVYFPDGMGRSKAPALIDRALKMPQTGRNWNTVSKLLELAEGMERARV